MMGIPPGYLPEEGTDPAEDRIGPFVLRRDPEHFSAGLLTVAHHANGMGNVHGGVLMTLADFALCAQARYQTEDAHIITVALNTQFVAGAQVGAFLHSEGRVVRRTRSLAFVQGLLLDGETVVLSYDGIGKRVAA